jgi:hypothetical protein
VTKEKTGPKCNQPVIGVVLKVGVHYQYFLCAQNMDAILHIRFITGSAEQVSIQFKIGRSTAEVVRRT